MRTCIPKARLEVKRVILKTKQKKMQKFMKSDGSMSPIIQVDYKEQSQNGRAQKREKKKKIFLEQSWEIMEYPQTFQTDFQKSHSFNDLHKRYFMGGKTFVDWVKSFK